MLGCVFEITGSGLGTKRVVLERLWFLWNATRAPLLLALVHDLEILSALVVMSVPPLNSGISPREGSLTQCL